MRIHRIERVAVKPGLHNLRLREKGDIRQWRRWAHHWFDKLWQPDNKGNSMMSREEAYEALSAALGVSIDEAHMGRMDAEECRRVVQWVRPIVDRNWESMRPETRERALEGY